MSKHRGMKPAAAILAVLLTTGAAFSIGQLYVKQAEKSFTAQETVRPSAVALSFLDRFCSGDFTGLFEDTNRMKPSLDTREAYEIALHELFDGLQSADFTLYENDDMCFSIFHGRERLADLYLNQDADGSWTAALPLSGNNSYLIEVPAGLSLSINGNPYDSSHIVEADIEASNYFQVYSANDIPRVDLYEISGLLSEPEFTDQNGNTLITIPDPMSGHLLAGTPVTDQSILDMILEAGENLALYPAEDAGISSVSAYAYSGSSWYSKYSSLQNYWFTTHSKYEISNEDVSDTIYQDNEHIVSHVIFDYYAENEEVSRTWHIGYQLTWILTDNGWKICGTEIDNELNPGQILPE